MEKAAELGGYGAKLLTCSTPTGYPFTQLVDSPVLAKIKEVETEANIRIMTNTEVIKAEGQPGLLDVTLNTQGGEETLRIGAVVMATGWKPYDPGKLDKYGYGASPDVITGIQMEEMAKNGKIVRPSDGKAPESVAFVLCAGRPRPGSPALLLGRLLRRVGEAGPVRAAVKPNAHAMILYGDIRIPGQIELFYKEAQSDPGVMLTKAEVTGVETVPGGKLRIAAKDTLLGAAIEIEADLVVLPTALVPRTTAHAPVHPTWNTARAWPSRTWTCSRALPIPTTSASPTRPVARASTRPARCASPWAWPWPRTTRQGAALKAIQAVELGQPGRGRASPCRRLKLPDLQLHALHPVQTLHRGMPLRRPGRRSQGHPDAQPQPLPPLRHLHGGLSRAHRQLRRLQRRHHGLHVQCRHQRPG